MLLCPWCETWHPLEDYIALQTPPKYPDDCPPIYKHGGVDGCKKLFSLFVRA